MPHRVRLKPQQPCADDIGRDSIRAGNDKTCLDRMASKWSGCDHGRVADIHGEMDRKPFRHTAMKECMSAKKALL